MVAAAQRARYPIEAISVHKSIREDEEAITFLFTLEKLSKCKAEHAYPVIMTLRSRIDIGGGAFDHEDLEGNGLIEINHGVNHKGDHLVSLTEVGRDLIKQLLLSKDQRILRIHYEVQLALSNTPVELRIDTHSGQQTLYWYSN
ncbi:MAG: hypothetical protein ACHQX1_01410 [Candidatus Micrarchaeales archaeon]